MEIVNYLNESFLKDAFKTEDETEKVAKRVSEDIVERKLELHQLVECLGFALVSTSPELRANGMKFLSTLLNNLPADHLNETELNFILTFFTDRIKDHHSVLPAVLDGFNTLFKMKNLPNDSIQLAFRSLFHHTACQSQMRTDRMKYYKLFKTALESHFEEISSMRADFIYGVINAVDGERDPRNLFFLFDFMPTFLKKLDLFHLTEEMFEVFACYFPIDFNPPKTENEEIITRDALANKLANCLVATDNFSDWIVDIALEKLESDLITAKLDSLDLLQRMCKEFESNKIDSYSERIWMALKIELLPGSNNPDILKNALRTLHHLVENLSVNENSSNNLLTKIFSTILPHLNDAHHRLFNPASEIALICVKSNPKYSSGIIINALLLKLESEDDVDAEQILKNFAIIAKILVIFNQKYNFDDMSSEITNRIRKQLLQRLSSSQNPEFNEILISCAAEILERFEKSHRIEIYKYLSEILGRKESKILKLTLEKFANLYPDELKELCVLPKLSEFHTFSREVQLNVYGNITDGILITHDSFRPLILNIILMNIFKPANTNSQETALKSLENILSSSEFSKAITEILHAEYKVIDKFVKCARLQNLSYSILLQISTILNLIARNLEQNEQNDVVKVCLAEIDLSIKGDIFILKGIFQGDFKALSYGNLKKLLYDLVQYSLTIKDDIPKEQCQYLLAKIFNGIEINEENEKILQDIIAELEKKIAENDSRALETLCWLTKGFLVRGSSSSDQLIEKMIDMIENENLSSTSVEGFRILSSEASYLQNKKLFYNQKLLHIFVKKAKEFLEHSSEKHLMAFVHILRTTPKNALKIYWELVGPIIMKCLQMNDKEILEISLNMIRRFLEAQDGYYTVHFSHLIPEFLNLTQYSKSMHIRILALQCLEAISKYPVYLILPYKSDILFGLIPALGDHKRFVRNAAAAVRNLWFLVDTATTDK